MFFTRFGFWIASLLVVLGVLRVTTSHFFAFGSDDPEQAARHILAAASTGQAINEGMRAILGGVVLGILAEISQNIRKRRSENES